MPQDMASDQQKNCTDKKIIHLKALLRHICVNGNMRQNLEHCLAWLFSQTPCQRLSVISIDKGAHWILPLAQIGQGAALFAESQPPRIPPLENLEHALGLGDACGALARIDDCPQHTASRPFWNLLAGDALQHAVLLRLYRDANRLCLLLAENSEGFAPDGDPAFLTCAQTIEEILRAHLVQAEGQVLQALPDAEKWTSRDMLAHCPSLADLTARLAGLAKTDATVLVLGESGVGKELVADALHELSPRRKEPFITVNCAALPENLADSLFFGHEKGSFTGALQTHVGYFEQANRGTLFLDEVAELSPLTQTRLLRVLETRSFRRVGGSKTISTDIRLVTATNRDLKELVRRGLFREDLFYRLYVYPLTVPALRNRREDIAPLSLFFYSQLTASPGMNGAPSLTGDQVARLCLQPWPGNVRQLRNVMERTLLEAVMDKSQSLDFSMALRDDDPSAAEQADSPKPGSLKEINARAIAAALRRSKGRIQGPHGAATLLGLSPNTLRARMRQLGIPLPRDAKAEDH